VAVNRGPSCINAGALIIGALILVLGVVAVISIIGGRNLPTDNSPESVPVNDNNDNDRNPNAETPVINRGPNETPVFRVETVISGLDHP
jgi:hypothetical protein